MKPSEARALLEGAVPKARGTWDDLGCGEGVFTEALLGILPQGSRIYAVDRDRRAIAVLGKKSSGPYVVPIIADFTQALELPEPLDGILLANVLHYVREQETVLAMLAALLRPDGRFVFIEYERRAANPWVPYPIGIAKREMLAAAAGLSKPMVTARKPSRFSGEIYVARADRLG